MWTLNVFCWILLCSAALCPSSDCVISTHWCLWCHTGSLFAAHICPLPLGLGPDPRTRCWCSPWPRPAPAAPHAHTQIDHPESPLERKTERIEGEERRMEGRRNVKPAKNGKKMTRHRKFKQACRCINVQSDESPPLTGSRMRGFAHAHLVHS